MSQAMVVEAGVRVVDRKCIQCRSFPNRDFHNRGRELLARVHHASALSRASFIASNPVDPPPRCALSTLICTFISRQNQRGHFRS